MEIFEHKSTAKTPYVNFNPMSGEMIIKGRVIPVSAEEFWTPLLKWVYAYSFNPVEKTKVIFDIEYYNISSSKQILYLLKKLNELFEKEHDVEIVWKYAFEDEEMKEAGKDFSCVVNVPFVFVPVDSVEIHEHLK